MKEVSVNNYAEMMGVNWDSSGQVETYGRLLKIVFKHLKVCYVKERLNLLCGRDWASAFVPTHQIFVYVFFAGTVQMSIFSLPVA